MMRGLLTVAVLVAGGCRTEPAPDRWAAETRNGELSEAKDRFLDAWMSGDLDALRSRLAPGFRGDDLVARAEGTSTTASGVTTTAWAGPASPVGPDAWLASAGAWRAGWAAVTDRDVHTWENDLDGGDLVALEHARFFGTTPAGLRREDRLHVRLTLSGGGLVSRVSVEEAWTHTAPDGAFVDVTDRVLPPGFDQVGAQLYTDAGPALEDADGDGDIDLFLPRMHAPARLYLNDGGFFEDGTEASGLALRALAEGTNAGLFFDHDADGDLDLAVGAPGVGIHLLLRDGTRYRPHPRSPFGGPRPYESLAAGDYDGDGRVDLFACAYGRIDADAQPGSYVDATDGAPNLLLRNVADVGFVDASEEAGLGPTATRWSYAAAWADHDRDGDLDLYVANDYGPNALLRNDGGRFVDVAEAAGAEDRGNGMAVSWLDADGDGVLDLYVSNMQSFAGNRVVRSPGFGGAEKALYRRFAQGNTLLRGLGDGRYRDVTAASGTKSAYWAWGSVPMDHDADGDTDLLCVTGMYTGPTSGDT